MDILGHDEAWKVASGRAVLLITNPNSRDSKAIRHIQTVAASCLTLRFHDIRQPIEGCVEPRREHIEKALKWSRILRVEDLLVTCHVGISRSPAMAYVLACSVMPPREAIKVLDPSRHIPNKLIIRLAADVLGSREVLNTFLFWDNPDLESLVNGGKEPS